MKTPITYYGGKQKLASLIVSLIPTHTLYCEPFLGGGAIFFSKPQSQVEVINDTNQELINFYRIVQEDFTGIEKYIKATLHSRDLHRKASVIYNNPDMFTDMERAWAFWTLASQSFASKIDDSWGYGISKNSITKKISNKRNSFTEEYAIRLQNVQIERADALRIIESRDNKDAFFYCDPPYYNSDCGHYNGYTIEDYENLLKTLFKLQGKFLLSSYPSKILTQYVKVNGWHQIKIEQKVSVANNNSTKPPKTKIEVLTSNYPIKLPN